MEHVPGVHMFLVTGFITASWSSARNSQCVVFVHRKALSLVHLSNYLSQRQRFKQPGSLFSLLLKSFIWNKFLQNGVLSICSLVQWVLFYVNNRWNSHLEGINLCTRNEVHHLRKYFCKRRARLSLIILEVKRNDS